MDGALDPHIGLVGVARRRLAPGLMAYFVWQRRPRAVRASACLSRCLGERRPQTATRLRKSLSRTAELGNARPGAIDI